MMRKNLVLVLQVTSALISVFTVSGCVVKNGESSDLILRGTIAESSEVVTLDPVFLAKQKKAEDLFFGSDNTIMSDSGRVPIDVDPTAEEEELTEQLASEPQTAAPTPYPGLNSAIHGVAKLFGIHALIWPVKGHLSSPYGMRRKHFHAGIDISAPKGTPIIASAPGQVLTAKRKGAYGNVVILSHDDDHQTLYGHMMQFAVTEGDVVQVGQVIGFVGRTGRATGNHVHFETRVAGGIPQNPLVFLPELRDSTSVSFNN